MEYRQKGGKMTELSKKLSINLIEARKARSLTQEALSKLSKTPRTTIASIERMESSPSIKTLNKLANALQVRIDELLSDRKSPVEEINYQSIKHRSFKDGGIKVFNLIPDKLDAIELERIEIKKGFLKTGTPHLPRTKEYFHVVEGSFEVNIAGETYTLSKGDLICFPGDQKHSYRGIKSALSTGISLIALS